jgi:sigma-B regulation protein RsbU (phosphoserine phosphatase)
MKSTKSKNSLSVKLSLTILSIVLLIFVLIIFINFKISQRVLLKEAENNARNVSRLTISQIEDALNSVENASKVVSGFISQNYISNPEIEKVLKLLAKNDQQVSSSFVLLDPGVNDQNPARFHYYFQKDENGVVQANSSKNDNFINSAIVKIIERNSAFWSEPYFDEASGEIEAAYMVPAYFSGANNALVKGIVGVEFRLKWLKDLIESKKIYKSDYIFIITTSGKPVITPRNRHDTDIFGIAKELNNPGILELGKKMMNGETGFTVMPQVMTHDKSAVYYAPVPSTEWSVAVVFPNSELYADLYLTTILMASVGLVGFILIFFAIIIILKRLTRPLRELSEAAEAIGQGNFEVIMPDIETNDEVGILKDSLESMQHELQTYIQNLIQSVKEKEHIESELQVAKTIQMGFLRNDFKAFSEGKDVEVAALLKPAREVGGDFYDYFMADENTMCVAIGDVSGKGISAALLMTIVLSQVRSGNYTTEHLKTIVSKINTALCAQNDNSMFTTFFIGLFNIPKGELTFCNAGHNFPYLLRNGELFEIRGTHGTALGVLEGQNFKTGRLVVNSGDTMILFTDGVTDAENQHGEFFNKSRFENAIIQSKNMNASGITAAIHSQVNKFINGFTPSDDLTLLVFKFKHDHSQIAGVNELPGNFQPS